MDNPASELSRRLAQDAEAVCRHYLPNGRRQGRYWIVGDVRNALGRSLYVRLVGSTSGQGAAGKWADAATGEHGDLLDLIAANLRLGSLRDTLDETRRFLSLPQPEVMRRPRSEGTSGSSAAARRLWAMAEPIEGTLAKHYLAIRGLSSNAAGSALRFHPRCYYWREGRSAGAEPEAWPALLARVTDRDGRLTGLQRTWLDPQNAWKAPLDPSRKAMGHLLGHGVHVGDASDVLAAGEGLETMLSLRMALPFLPIVAALSASHLAALLLPDHLDRLYIAVDADPPGRHAAMRLADHAKACGIATIRLHPRLGDFNDDLRAFGVDELRAHLRPQLAPVDAARLLANIDR